MSYGPQSGYVPPAGVSIAPGTDIQTVINANSAGTIYILQAGVHRLQTVIPKNGDELHGQYGAILSGAQLLSSWTYDAGVGAWKATGQTQGAGAGAGECLVTYPRCGYPEELFRDDERLRHVTSTAALSTGTWFFNYATDTIYVKDDPSGHTLEASITTVGLDGGASSVKVQNLVVEKYANQAQTGAIRGGSNWTLQDVDASRNHGIGIAMGDFRVTLTCRANHNGQMGMGGSGIGYAVSYCEIAFNNEAGFDPAWEAGGTKFTSSTTFLLNNNYVHHNAGPGLWLDINNDDFTIEYNRCTDNYSPNNSASPGIFIEISQGGVIRFNECRRNGVGFTEWLWASQILIAASGGTGLDIHDNITSGLGGIGLIQQYRPELGGPHLVLNVHVYDNDITTNGLTGAVQDYGGSSVFDNSTWTGNIYHTTTGGYHFAWNNSQTNFAGWQAYGNDLTGSDTGWDGTPPPDVGVDGGSGGEVWDGSGAIHPPTAPGSVLVGSHSCCEDPDAPVTTHPGNVTPPVGPEWVSLCIGGGVVPSAVDLSPSELWDA